MKKVITSLLFGLVAFILSGTPIVKAEEVKIGVIISQTGPVALIGQGIVNAVVLSSEKNDPEHKVKFIFEDDSLQPTKAVSAAEKLINNDHVSAMIAFSGGTSAAVAPIAEKKQVPLITIAAGDLHTIGKSYVYRQYLSTTSQVKLVKDEMDRQQLKRIAIVTTTQESLVRLRDLFKESAGNTIVADEEVLPTDSDMRSLATRINSKRPDAILLYLLPPQLALFSEALRTQGSTAKFFGGFQIYNFPQIVASHGALIGTIFPTPAIGGPGEGFHQEYLKRFRECLASEQEVYGYDIAKTLIEASATGNIQSYLQALKETQGLAGTYQRRENNFFEVPAVLKVVKSETSVE